MKTARTSAICASALVVCILFFCVVVWRVSDGEVRRGGRLLQELGQLELGPSTARQARALIHSYGLRRVSYPPLAMVNCGGGDESYQVSIRPELADRISRKMPSWLVRMRLVPNWQIDAAVQFQDGEVECAGAFVYFPHAHAVAGFAGVMRSRVPYDSLDEYDVTFETPQEFLSVSSLPGASPAQKASAIEPDLMCLTRFAGCRFPCELSPFAWHFYQTTPDWEHLLLGWGKPPDADDSRCKGNNT